MMMKYTEYADVEHLKTPSESITGRIEQCEDPAERHRLEKMRSIYELDLPPTEMAKQLMELHGRRGAGVV